MSSIADEPKTPTSCPAQALNRLRSQLDLVEALSALEASEFLLDESLSKLTSSNEQFDQSLHKIGQLGPVVSTLLKDASTLHEAVYERAAVAERISSKVRVLDLEQNRVKECIDRVQAATELKDAFGQTLQAIERKDWEAATRHIQRANAIDKDFLISKFAEAVVPTVDIPDPPLVALNDFVIQLTGIFLKAFEDAARSKDEAATTRFFKLFPLLGSKASATGLGAYSDFVRTLISVPSSFNRPGGGARQVSVVVQCTSVFEQLALIIDQHQAMVDKYYGARSMVTVTRRLHEEMDKLILKFLSEWESGRQVERRLTSASRCSFTVLTQLLAENPNIGPTNLINTQAALQNSLRSLAGNVQRTYNINPNSSPGPNPATLSVEEETEDPREIDALTDELASISARWQTYRRFLHSRFVEENISQEHQKEDEKNVNGNGHEKELETSPLEPETVLTDERRSPATPSSDSTEIEDKLFRQTEVFNSIQSLLEKVYLPLETWYFRFNMEKAHASDELELNTPPYLSSALDDAFYITKKVILRLVNSGEVGCVKRGLRQIRDILERDFGEVMKRRLENVASSMATGASSTGSGGVGFGIGTKTGEEKEKRERIPRNSYIVYLNNLSMASEYTFRLIDEVATGPLYHSFFVPKEFEVVKAALEDLKLAEKKFSVVAKGGLDQLFNQLVRPRIRSILSECYKDVTYILDEDSYAEAEFQDIFRKRFSKAWENLMEPYRESLTPKNLREFFSMTINVLARSYENLIRNFKFSELGVMKFDKDLRFLTSYLSNQLDFSLSLINENFIRLKQICLLLELDEDEDDGGGLKKILCSETSINWRLTTNEIKNVLAQKC